MSLKKFISAITLAFAFVAFSTFVSAQETQRQDGSVQKQEKFGKRGGHGKGMRGGKRGGMMMRGLHQLNLSDTQKEQIRGIMQANRAQNQGTHEEFRQIMQTRRSGATLTAEQESRLQVIKQQMKANSDVTKQQVMAILTVEQRTQFEQMKEQRRQKMQERKQNRLNRQSSSSEIN